MAMSMFFAANNMQYNIQRSPGHGSTAAMAYKGPICSETAQFVKEAPAFIPAPTDSF